MHPEDAKYCSDYGADALVVSNHGGRQLDGAPSSISRTSRDMCSLVGHQNKCIFRWRDTFRPRSLSQLRLVLKEYS